MMHNIQHRTRGRISFRWSAPARKMLGLVTVCLWAMSLPLSATDERQEVLDAESRNEVSAAEPRHEVMDASPRDDAR